MQFTLNSASASRSERPEFDDNGRPAKVVYARQSLQWVLGGPEAPHHAEVLQEVARIRAAETQAEENRQQEAIREQARLQATTAALKAAEVESQAAPEPASSSILDVREISAEDNLNRLEQIRLEVSNASQESAHVELPE